MLPDDDDPPPHAARSATVTPVSAMVKGCRANDRVGVLDAFGVAGGARGARGARGALGFCMVPSFLLWQKGHPVRVAVIGFSPGRPGYERSGFPSGAE